MLRDFLDLFKVFVLCVICWYVYSFGTLISDKLDTLTTGVDVVKTEAEEKLERFKERFIRDE